MWWVVGVVVRVWAEAWGAGEVEFWWIAGKIWGEFWGLESWEFWNGGSWVSVSGWMGVRGNSGLVQGVGGWR